MGALDGIATVALQRPHGVIAAWLVAAAIGAVFAVDVVNSCRFQFDPVPGTQSDRALKRFHADFPKLIFRDNEAVLVSCLGPCSSVEDAPFAEVAVRTIRAKMFALNASHVGIVQNWTDHFEYRASALGRLRPSPLMAPSNRTLLFQLAWQVLPANQQLVGGMLDDLTNIVRALDAQGRAQQPPVGLALTGALALFADTLKSTENDLKTRHVFVLPLALLVLLYRIRSWRLCLLPAFSLLCSVATSMGLFVPFAKHVISISPFAPTVMVFITIALSIDYSLFLLTRFREEMQHSDNIKAALRTMLLQSGHVVVVSGTVLMISYLGVLAFPGGGISTVGLGAAFAIGACMASNLTLTPALIAAFPGFFAAPKAPVEQRRSLGGWFRRGGSEGRDVAEAFVAVAPAPASAGCWPKFAAVVTRRPWAYVIPVVGLALLLPPVVEVFQYQESFSNSLGFPKSGMAAEAHRRLSGEFPPGVLAPTFVVQPVVQTSATTAIDDEAMERHFRDLCRLAQRFLDEVGPTLHLEPQHLLGLGFVPDPGNALKLQCVEWRLAKMVMMSDSDAGTIARDAWAQLMSPGNRSSLVVINAPFDPFSESMRAFVHGARRALPAPPSEALAFGAQASEEDALMFSASSVLVDIVEISYDRFPYILAVTIALVFTVIAVAFRAALAPVKMFFTVVVPLGAVFGVAVWIYQVKVLSWLGISALSSPDGAGLFWGTPIVTCTIIIGLALDYDVFLFARVVELRRLGFDNVSAVRGAVGLTGPIITSAGLIMAIAFAGLLLCDVPMNNQIGFVMAFGVLMDTFLIRTCLVPSVLTLAAGLNYWPQSLPPVSKTAADLDDWLRDTGAACTGSAPSSLPIVAPMG